MEDVDAFNPLNDPEKWLKAPSGDEEEDMSGDSEKLAKIGIEPDLSESLVILGFSNPVAKVSHIGKKGSQYTKPNGEAITLWNDGTSVYFSPSNEVKHFDSIPELKQFLAPAINIAKKNSLYPADYKFWDADPFAGGSPEDKAMDGAGFIKTAAGTNGIIVYDHPDGSFVQIHPPHEDHNMPMQIIVHPAKGGKCLFSYQNPKTTIESFLAWLGHNYTTLGHNYYTTLVPSTSSAKKQQIDTESHSLLVGRGYEGPKEIKTITGKPALEYHKPTTNEYVVVFDDGTFSWQYIEKGKPAEMKTFDGVQGLYDFLKGDPKYTGKKMSLPEAVDALKEMGFEKITTSGGFEAWLLQKKDKTYQVQLTLSLPPKIVVKVFKGILLNQWEMSIEEGIPQLKKDLGVDDKQNPEDIFSGTPLKGELTSEHLVKLGFTFAGKTSSDFYRYTKVYEDPSHGEILHEVLIAPVLNEMSSIIYMKDKTGPWAPMQTFKWKSIKQGINQLELWMGEKPEQMELPGTKTEMPFSGYDYHGKGIDQGLSNKASIALHKEDAKVLESLGFEYKVLENPSVEWYQKDRQEQITFYGDGSAKYWDTGLDADKPIHKFTNVKDAMQFLWDKHHESSPEKSSSLLDPGKYPDLNVYLNPETGGYKSGIKMKLRIKDNQAVLAKGFVFFVEGDEAMEYHHPNGDWFFIQSNGLMNYNLGGENSAQPIEKGFQVLKDKYFDEGNFTKTPVKAKTGDMPYSGASYKTTFAPIVSPTDRIRLNSIDEATMKEMGFRLFYDDPDTSTKPGYKKVLDVKTFEAVWFYVYANGTSKASSQNVPSLTKGGKGFSSVKEGMQFLWDNYAPFIEESTYKPPIEESSYKRFMIEFLG
jgi:hypothetical protein